MELDLATIDDIVNELKHRQIGFILMAENPTNLGKPNVSYAYQASSTDEVLCMLEEMRQLLMDRPPSADFAD